MKTLSITEQSDPDWKHIEAEIDKKLDFHDPQGVNPLVIDYLLNWIL